MKEKKKGYSSIAFAVVILLNQRVNIRRERKKLIKQSNGRSNIIELKSARVIMPVHRPSRPIATTSNSRKSMGFSINDIIKNDDPSKISPRHNPPPIPSYLPPTSWIPPPTNMDPIIQYQLQYLRHSGRLFDGRFASKLSFEID